MPQPTEPHAAESVAVQLTRMEGVLNLVAERTVNLTSRMDVVEGRTSGLEVTTQRLDLEATEREKRAVALALALKDQEAERRVKSESTLPTRTVTVMVAIAGIAMVILAYLAG